MTNTKDLTDQRQLDLIGQLSKDCPLCHDNLMGTCMSTALNNWAYLLKIALSEGGVNPIAACQAIFHLGIRVGVEYANTTELEELGRKGENNVSLNPIL